MNKEFVKKIIKSECLKYEAVKEILPDSLKKRVDSFEKEAASLAKDIVIEMMSESIDKNGEEKEKTKKETKKVNVDFS